MYFIDETQLIERIYFIIFNNSSSEMIGIFKFSAFSRLLGPILSPAIKKLVLDEIEDDTFPPLSSMSFLSSFEISLQIHQKPQRFGF